MNGWRARNSSWKISTASPKLGLAFKAMRKWTDATQAFREALKITPEQPATLYNLGVCLHNTDEYEEAIRVLQETVRLKPDYASAHYELGLVYIATGDTDAAYEEYVRLLDLNGKLAKKLYEAMPVSPRQQSSPPSTGIDPSNVDIPVNLSSTPEWVSDPVTAHVPNRLAVKKR